MEEFTTLKPGTTLTNLTLNIFATGGGNVRIKAYQDDGAGGAPSTLLGESGSQVISGTGLQNFTISAVVPTSGNIWIGFEVDSATTSFWYKNQVADSYAPTFIAHTYGSGPSPFGSGTCCSTNEFYMKAYSVSPSTAHVRIKAYQDDGAGGAPSTLLGESGSQVISGTGFQNYTITSSVPASGNIWIGFEVDNSGTSIYYTNQVPDAFAPTTIAHTYGSGPSPFGSGTCCSTNEFYMKIHYNLPTIKLTPSSGSIGTNLNVNGSQFGSNKIVNIYYDGVFKGNTITDSNGKFNCSGFCNFAVPSGVIGAHTVNASDSSSPSKIALATFTINGASLILDQSNANVGSTVHVSGIGFHNNTSIQFKYDSNNLLISPPFPQTNSTGGFSGLSFHVPKSVSGNHNVNGSDTFGNNATAILNVTSSITATPNPAQVYNLISVYGDGFLASHSITIKYDGSTVASTSTNTAGSFSNSTFNLPNSIAGSHTISATDASHTATYSITVKPTLTISPSSGIRGTTVTLSGKGYAATSHVNFYFNNVAIISTPISVTTNATGSFNSVTITVPNVSFLGTYDIKATDASTNTVSKSFTVTSISPSSPSAVSDLHTTFINDTKIGLAWTQPALNGNSFVGYQINYTTPNGTPNTVITNNTGSSSTSFTVSGLSSNTAYSFRIGIWATPLSNPYGNILDISTSTGFTPANMTVGKNQGVVLNATNPATFPIKYYRTDLDANTTRLDVVYPNTYNLSCSFNYEFALTNKTYSNLSSVPYDTNNVKTTFQFNHISTEIIQVSCIDTITGVHQNYVLTQNNSPFLQQIQNFRNGTYGTTGKFGALDFITLIVIILSMIGLNRLNETVGAIFSIIILGILGYFHVIEWPSIIISILALIVMLAVTTTRKN